MERTRKILKKLPQGGFFLHKDPSSIRKISEGKRTKLWLSSDFLFNQLIKENPEHAKKTLEYLISWNLSMERYNECKELEKLLRSIN